MNWYTYSLGGRFTIIVAETLQGDGRVYCYRYAVATNEIQYRDLPYIIQHIQKSLNKGIYHGVA
jgi:hypothetical protein